MNILRIKGLFFLIAMLAATILTLTVFSGTITKMVLESQLSSLNNAEVNIDEVDVSFIPLSIKLGRIQATNNDNPLTNSVELKKATLEIDSKSLLRGRFVINELLIDNIEFMTSRKKAGKVYTAEDAQTEDTVDSKENDADFMSAASFKLPDIDELVNKMDLQSTKGFKAVNEKAEATKASWDSIKQRLSDKNKWDEYSRRYEGIKQTLKKGRTKEKLQALKDLKVLKNEVQNELSAIRNDKNKLKKESEELKVLYNLAKKLPEKDLEKLKSSYSLDSANVENISRLIFSDDISSYIATAANYYNKFKPYLTSTKESEEKVAREKGRRIEFKEEDPQPGFLVKDASFTATLPSGLFEGKASNVGFEQNINNKVSIIELHGKKLRHSKAEKIAAILDIREKNSPSLVVNYDIEQRNINQYKVSGGTTLPLVIETAKLDLHSNVRLMREQMNAELKSQFRQVKFTSSKSLEGNNFPALIAAAMLDIKEFEIDANVKGTLGHPVIKVKSDIDNKINKQLSARFSRIKSDYEKALKLKLKDKYSADLENVEKSLSALNEAKKDIEMKQDEITNKLNKFKS